MLPADPPIFFRSVFRLIQTVVVCQLTAGSLSATPFATAYVANSGSNSISVVSLTTQSVVNTIPVGDGPRYVAFTPNGARAYVTNENADTVSVIDTASQTVINTLNVGDNPEQIVIAKDGLHAYVANYLSSSISVIDLTNNSVSTISTPVNPSSLALHPTRDELWIGYGPTSGNRVLEARPLSNLNSVLDFEDSSLRYYAASDLKFWPDGSMAIGSEGCGFCGRFHKISGSLPITVPQPDILYDNLGAGRGVAINPVNGVAYLAKLGQNGGINRVVEFGGLGRTLPTADPRELAVAPAGDFAYLTQLTQGGPNPGSVAVINTSTFSIVNTIPVEVRPHGIAIQPGLLGDYNFNGVVDAADYVVWRNTLGQVGPALAADGNNNQAVDLADYGIWRSHFGQTAGSGAALPSAEPLSAAVPEPSALLLAGLAALAFSHRRRISGRLTTRQNDDQRAICDRRFHC